MKVSKVFLFGCVIFFACKGMAQETPPPVPVSAPVPADVNAPPVAPTPEETKQFNDDLKDAEGGLHKEKGVPEPEGKKSEGKTWEEKSNEKAKAAIEAARSRPKSTPAHKTKKKKDKKPATKAKTTKSKKNVKKAGKLPKKKKPDPDL